LEIRHRSVRPISAKHAQASRFLQQSPQQCEYRMLHGVSPWGACGAKPPGAGRVGSGAPMRCGAPS
ncbi:hypothetical protein EJ607_08240, partial [Pseudomonas aeruginosa]